MSNNSDKFSLDSAINQFLREELHDSENVKSLDIYSHEQHSSYEIGKFFMESTMDLKSGQYAFFYRGDGNGGWKNEHLLLKRCEKTLKLGTVFVEGSLISNVLGEIVYFTNNLILEDSNQKY